MQLIRPINGYSLWAIGYHGLDWKEYIQEQYQPLYFKNNHHNETGFNWLALLGALNCNRISVTSMWWKFVILTLFLGNWSKPVTCKQLFNFSMFTREIGAINKSEKCGPVYYLNQQQSNLEMGALPEAICCKWTVDTQTSV